MTGGVAIEAAVRRAIVAAIEADTALGGAINGVFEPGAAGISAPYVLVGAMTARDWGTKDRDGREIVATVEIRDARRAGDDVAGLAAQVAAAVGAMARGGEGFEVASVRLRNCAIARGKSGEWVAIIDFRVRALAS